MRPPALSVLSAVVVVILLASACRTDPSIDADAPEADSSSQGGAEQDRGVEVDPLPTPTPTAPSPTVDSDEPAAPPSAADLGLDIPSYADRDYAVVWGNPVMFGSGDVVPIDIDVPEAPRTIYPSLPFDGRVVTATNTTPDGAHIWVPMDNPSGDPVCSEESWALGVLPLDGSGPAHTVRPPIEPIENVTAVHYGPQSHVLLYTGCGDEQRPLAFAQAADNGELHTIRPVHEAFAQTIRVYPPRWIWGDSRPIDDVFTNPGGLIAVIPQIGLPDGRTENGGSDIAGTVGPADAYVHVATGEILDIWPNTQVLQGGRHYGLVTSDTNSVTMATGTLEPFELDLAGFVTTIVEEPWAIDRFTRVVAAGDDGAVVVTRQFGRDQIIERVTDDPVAAVAWAPVGSALVLAGPTGTVAYDAGTTHQLSNAPAETVYFTPDGASLIIGGPDGYERIDFAPIAEPDDAQEVTSFSSLDSGGLGPIRVDATVSETEALLGIDFTIEGIEEILVGYCVWIHSDELGGIYLLGEATSQDDAIIKRVTVDSPPWFTPSGLRVGSTEDAVLAALGRQITQQRHAYTAGKYLDFSPVDDNDPYGVRFETNGHQVISISVGRPDWIRLVEGCL